MKLLGQGPICAVIRDSILRDSHYENNCMVWDGSLSKRFGPIMNIDGHSHSVRRVVYQDLHGLPMDDTEVFKAIDGKCHWRCINLQHFRVEVVAYYHRRYGG